jgi:hypothetical protein
MAWGDLAKGRWLRAALVMGGVAVAVALGRGWPKERTVRYVLGDYAAITEELEARWSPEGHEDASGELRTVSFRFRRGSAPRVVTHAVRVPDGTYDVEIALVSAGRHMLIRRRVSVPAAGVSGAESSDFGGGDTISIDLAAGLPPAHDVTLEPRSTGPR